MGTWSYPIRLYGKQRLAVQSKADEILFGGSLAGGKTEMILKHMVDICLLIPHAKVLIIRKNFPQMVEIEQRLRKRVPAEVAVPNKADHVFRFYNGAELHLGFLASEEDAERYQGHEYVKVGFDELTHYDKSWVAAVVSRIRADQETQDLMESYGLTMGMLAASNPGSRGHGWVKETFIDPHPLGNQEFVGPDGVRRVFIPSSLWDNPYIDHESYIRRLGGYSEERKRAMIHGDWSVPEGTRFSNFRTGPVFAADGTTDHPGHVIKPEDLPLPLIGLPRVLGVDFGFQDPTAGVWLAKMGTHVIVYREFEEKGLTSSEQAKALKECEADGERAPGRRIVVSLDPAAWRRNPDHVGPKLGDEDAPFGSTAYHYRNEFGGDVVKGINARVPGWAVLDELMVVQEDGLPGLLIYDSCPRLIKALQSAPRDKRRPEDVDTNWYNEHLLDALRYGCMEILGRSAGGEENAFEEWKRSQEQGTETGDLLDAKF